MRGPSPREERAVLIEQLTTHLTPNLSKEGGFDVLRVAVGDQLYNAVDRKGAIQVVTRRVVLALLVDHDDMGRAALISWIKEVQKENFEAQENLAQDLIQKVRNFQSKEDCLSTRSKRLLELGGAMTIVVSVPGFYVSVGVFPLAILLGFILMILMFLIILRNGESSWLGAGPAKLIVPPMALAGGIATQEMTATLFRSEPNMGSMPIAEEVMSTSRGDTGYVNNQYQDGGLLTLHNNKASTDAGWFSESEVLKISRAPRHAIHHKLKDAGSNSDLHGESEHGIRVDAGELRQAMGIAEKDSMNTQSKDILFELPSVSKSIVNGPNSYRPSMVWIPPGEFWMGSPVDEAGRSQDEKRHKVILKHGFWLGDTEVTQGQWAVVMGLNPSFFNETRRGKIDYPVEQVSWFDAIEYLNQLSKMENLSPCYNMRDCNGLKCRKIKRTQDCTGYRLPTEAEWEYAARGGASSSTVSKSSPLSERAWFSGNCKTSRSVRHKNKNRLGLYDIIGNVWELTEDAYNTSFPKMLSDPINQWYVGNKIVIRGCGWYSEPLECRIANRGSVDPSTLHFDVGIRPARSK